MTVEPKGNLPLDVFPAETGLLRLLLGVTHLKHIYRTGWTDEELGRNVPRHLCESVADHCNNVTVFSYIIAKSRRPDLDITKVMEYAIVHDLAESLYGDHTPHEGKSYATKFDEELASLDELLKQTPEMMFIRDRWIEYSKDPPANPEALFVRSIDKLETAFQAVIYEAGGYKGIDEFFSYCEKK
jgi:putative hydrolases of HD superfamily